MTMTSTIKRLALLNRVHSCHLSNAFLLPPPPSDVASLPPRVSAWKRKRRGKRKERRSPGRKRQRGVLLDARRFDERSFRESSHSTKQRERERERNRNLRGKMIRNNGGRIGHARLVLNY